jgi:hypothetical protein
MNDLARRRMEEWRRVIEAVAEQRAALEYRIWAEDPDDLVLHDDVRIWGELTSAVAGLPQSKEVGMIELRPYQRHGLHNG